MCYRNGKVAGSPVKRARAMGLAIPNMGDKPPRIPKTPCAPVRETDAEFALLGKRVLAEIAEDLGGEHAGTTRVNAATALIAATQVAPAPIPQVVVNNHQALATLPQEQLLEESRQAIALLEQASRIDA